MGESFDPPTEEDPPRESSEPSARHARRPAEKPSLLEHSHVRLGAVIAVAAAVGLIIWAILGSGGGGKSSSTTAQDATKPVALSLGGLRTFAGALHQPIYWVGPRRSVSYELSQASGGKTYVRYLPSGVKAGDPKPYLTVGTYPLPNAYAITKGISEKAGIVSIPLGTGTVGYYVPANRTNAYVAFDGSDYQMEVFDPRPGVARSLVAQSRVASVPGAAPPGVNAIAVSAAGLKSLAARLGQTIYWAGPEPGVTYEVRQLPSGFVYVRYLPKGVPVGDPGPHRTIATYPMGNAFVATQNLATGKGNHGTITLPDGGIGVYTKPLTASNVYVAFPGAAYQVEVYDPKAGGAVKLVAAKKIVVAG